MFIVVWVFVVSFISGIRCGGLKGWFKRNWVGLFYFF